MKNISIPCFKFTSPITVNNAALLPLSHNSNEATHLEIASDKKCEENLSATLQISITKRDWEEFREALLEPNFEVYDLCERLKGLDVERIDNPMPDFKLTFPSSDESENVGTINQTNKNTFYQHQEEQAPPTSLPLTSLRIKRCIKKTKKCRQRRVRERISCLNLSTPRCSQTQKMPPTPRRETVLKKNTLTDIFSDFI